jgi:phospholipid transport system substrate-binding protein
MPSEIWAETQREKMEKNRKEKNRIWLWGYGLLFALLLLNPLKIYALTPMETMKDNLDKVLQVLHDPELKGEAGKQIKIEKISRLSEKIFDFSEMSKRSLGLYWKKLSDEQKARFVKLYRLLLKRTYADKIVSSRNEEIIYGRVAENTSAYVEVQTTVSTGKQNISVNYRLMRVNNDWEVYDVVVEGVSLVQNYRQQFREILGKNSVEKLFDILEKKVGQEK